MTTNLTTTTTGIAKAKASDKALAAFLAKGTGKAALATIQATDSTPRMIFALDATASRQPTWAKAAKIQGEMFDAMSGKGNIQLASFGGMGFRASRWADDSRELKEDMAAVSCVAGHTQIGALLTHVEAEAAKGAIRAVAFIGDTCEENAEVLIARAARLKVLGAKVFVFHEIGDASAAPTLRAIAEASGGAYMPLPDSITATADMQTMLGAVAAYTSGGRAALLAYGKAKGSDKVLQIAHQLKIEGPKG